MSCCVILPSLFHRSGSRVNFRDTYLVIWQNLGTSLHPLEQALLNCWPAEKWSGVTVLVAFSGGADSVALTLALSRLQPAGTTIHVAHFNHRLRGQDADDDASFVEQFCQRHGLACTVGITSVAAEKVSPSEADLRAVRYDFLTKLAGTIGARYIVTAHTADDQVETVLHRLCRGSGLRGLGGIREFQPLGEFVLARPLLHVWRADVLDYLETHDEVYRTDASNASDQYTRNRIRQHIVPALQERVQSDAPERIATAAMMLRNVYDFMQQQCEQFCEDHIQFGQSEVRIAANAIREIHSALGVEVLRHVWCVQGWPLRDMSAEVWQSLLQGVIRHSQRISNEPRMYPGGIEIVVEGDAVIFRIASSQFKS